MELELVESSVATAAAAALASAATKAKVRPCPPFQMDLSQRMALMVFFLIHNSIGLGSGLDKSVTLSNHSSKPFFKFLALLKHILTLVYLVKNKY